jgi:hypothetical protein
MGAVRVEGLRELRRGLKQLGEDCRDLKDANAATAAIVATAAAARAPHRTGRLAASIRGNRAVGKAVVRGGGARVPYAGPVHWGWPARHITGQPFISEAAVATEPVWLPPYEQALSRAVDRVTQP